MAAEKARGEEVRLQSGPPSSRLRARRAGEGPVRLSGPRLRFLSQTRIGLLSPSGVGVGVGDRDVELHAHGDPVSSAHHLYLHLKQPLHKAHGKYWCDDSENSPLTRWRLSLPFTDEKTKAQKG